VDVTLLLLALFSTVGLVFTYLAVTERDLVRAVVYSAVQSSAYAVLLYLLRAPDIVLVYIPVSVGLYPAALLFLIGKTERVDGE
jgi:uncharacterized MnhB-related membrane protein